MPIDNTGLAIASAISAVVLIMLTLFVLLTGKPFCGANVPNSFLSITVALLSLLTDVATAKLLIATPAKG